MPASFYIPAESEHIDVAKDFLNFVASPEGCDIITQTIGAIGPYMVEGCELPPDVPKSVTDMLPYFETDGAHRSRARVPLAGQGSGTRADHRRGRLGHPLCRRRRRALRPGRREAGQAARTARVVARSLAKSPPLTGGGPRRGNVVSADRPIPTGSSCPAPSSSPSCSSCRPSPPSGSA